MVICCRAYWLPQIKITEINNSIAKLWMDISRPYWKGEHYLLTRNRWLFPHFVHIQVFILAPDIGKQYPPKVKRAIIHVNDLDWQVGQACKWLWVRRPDLWLSTLGEATACRYLGLAHVITIIFVKFVHTCICQEKRMLFTECARCCRLMGRTVLVLLDC